MICHEHVIARYITEGRHGQRKAVEGSRTATATTTAGATEHGSEASAVSVCGCLRSNTQAELSPIASAPAVSSHCPRLIPETNFSSRRDSGLNAELRCNGQARHGIPVRSFCAANVLVSEQAETGSLIGCFAVLPPSHLFTESMQQAPAWNRPMTNRHNLRRLRSRQALADGRFTAGSRCSSSATAMELVARL